MLGAAYKRFAFAPRLFQQVLSWSERRVLGAAPASRAPVKAPFGGMLKAKIPPVLPGRGSGLLAESGSGNTGF